MWWRALLVGGLLAGLVGACAVVDPVDQRYDTVTRSLAKARNEAIFLNLIRASHDDPLSFATIANVTPTMTNTSSFALPSFSVGPPNCLPGLSGATHSLSCAYATGVPGAATALGSSTASNSTAVSTNFNVSTEETGSFYEGFLKPIDLTILDYFIRQGYPREMLFWLFTDSFELTGPGHHPLGFHYSLPDDLGCDPNDRQKHRCFIDWVHEATLSGLTVEEKTQQRPARSERGGGESSGTNPTAKPTTFTYARFCFSYVLAEQADAVVQPKSLIEQSKNDSDVTATDVYNGKLRCGSPDWHPEQDATKPQEDILPLEFRGGTIKFRIIPRSAYGVFVFLGQLMKLQRQDYKPSPTLGRPWVADLPPLLATVDNEPLINVEQNYSGPCFVHSWYEDGDYCVPDSATNTKRIFGLLAQLIAIQTAASDLSITPIVRVIE